MLYGPPFFRYPFAHKQGDQLRYAHRAASSCYRTKLGYRFGRGNPLLRLAGLGLVGFLGFKALHRFYWGKPASFSQDGMTAFPSYLSGVRMKLISTKSITPDVKMLKFELPKNYESSGLKPGSAVLASIKHSKTGKLLMRPYSPIYTPGDQHHLVFAIKMLNSQGASGAMHTLLPGDMVKFRGPKPGRSVDLSTISSVNLIAGGSGITPLYSVLNYLMTEKPDSRVNLIFANKSMDDIIFKKELDALHEQYSNRFLVTYVVDRENTPATPSTVVGRINPDLLEKTIWKDSDIFVCGPDGMVSALRKQMNLDSFTDRKVVVF
ncbi:hypothetical protein FOA43_003639 [Brettanomyces nanus]|uniref:NADH-cytochrome b5 reductase n=1 Tax=Eeniella nana TaxID=13502 RepID=A0A875S5P8_EENNA|nr:uncharacterized protein FOA43_003639 [Brettanomyces nanus]QPG76253.1 hypothetical protein FOA43_003639 [Brettanomyces nanus]